MIVIIKPTTACNGTCLYCSTESGPTGKPFMPKESLKGLFGAFARWLRRDPSRSLDLIWHGGEPLMSGLDFYDTVIAEQDRMFQEDLGRVRNYLQSNLTLLTDEWIPRFEKLLANGGIGTSVEIVEGIRGLGNGDSLMDKWLSAVGLLHDHGLSTGVLYIVHKRSLGLAGDLYDFFQSLPGMATVRFNPLYKEGRGRFRPSKPLHLKPDEYGQFLVNLWKVWRKDGLSLNVAPLGEWARAWLGDPSGLCCDSGGRCHETHLGIGPDGSVYGCGRALESRLQRFGNIFDDDLNRILKHPMRIRLASRASRLQEGPCQDCSFWKICQGGCPVDGWIYYGDVFRETYFCPSRKRLFEYFETVFGPLSPYGYFNTTGQEKSPISFLPDKTDGLKVLGKFQLLDLKHKEKVSREEMRSAIEGVGGSPEVLEIFPSRRLPASSHPALILDQRLIAGPCRQKDIQSAGKRRRCDRYG